MALILLQLFLVACVTIKSTAGYVEALAVAYNPPEGSINPMVAVHCDAVSKHVNLTTGKWQNNPDGRVDCFHNDYQSILDHCSEMYPGLEITNIIQSTDKTKIIDFCREGNQQCHITHKVTPFTCVVGEFQSVGLMVPKGCKFYHLRDVDTCLLPDEWLPQATTECHTHGSLVHSHGMLSPCALDKFTGIEFVCCSEVAESESKEQVGITENTHEEYTDDVYLTDQESYEYHNSNPDNGIVDDYTDLEKQIADEITSVNRAEPSRVAMMADDGDLLLDIDDLVPDVSDGYFRNTQDISSEHREYVKAEHRLQQSYEEQMTLLMAEWDEADQDYQQLKTYEPIAADNMKKNTIKNFQATVTALEEEYENQREQLRNTHQQHIELSINRQKAEAMDNLMAALEELPSKPHKILQGFKHYLRIQQKDRIHNMEHFIHVERHYPEKALDMEARLIKHLQMIDVHVNQTVHMIQNLRDVDSRIHTKLRHALNEYTTDGKDTRLTMQVEEAVIDMTQYMRRKQQQQQQQLLLQQQQQAEEQSDDVSTTDDVSGTVDQGLDDFVSSEPGSVVAFDDEAFEDETDFQPIKVAQDSKTYSAMRQSGAVQHQADSALIGSMAGTSQNYAHLQTVIGLSCGAVVIVSVIVIAVVVFRKKQTRNPVQHGFIVVDHHMSMEERHISNMQQNGYENPTYKYFESN